MTEGYGQGPPLVPIFPNWPAEHNTDGTHKKLGGLIAICDSAAEIIAACEDSGINEVWILEGHYDFSATIIITNFTKVLGIGDVELDWTGANNGWMIMNYASGSTDCHYENLHFVKTGNNYYPIRGYDRNRMYRVRCDNTGQPVYVDDCADFYAENCDFLGGLTLWSGDHVTIVKCDMGTATTIIASVSYLYAYDCHFDRISPTPSVAEKNWVFESCKIYDNGTVSVLYDPSGSGTLTNLWFVNCYMQGDASQYFIGLNSTNELNDVWFVNNVFETFSQVYRLNQGTQRRWHFICNTYKSCTTIRFFTGGTQVEFSYVMDGGFPPLMSPFRSHSVSIDNTDSPYALDTAPYLIFVDASAGNVVINVGIDKTANEGAEIVLVRTDTNNAYTVTVNGSTNSWTFGPSSRIRILCDGTTYYVSGERMLSGT